MTIVIVLLLLTAGASASPRVLWEHRWPGRQDDGAQLLAKYERWLFAAGHHTPKGSERNAALATYLATKGDLGWTEQLDAVGGVETVHALVASRQWVAVAVAREPSGRKGKGQQTLRSYNVRTTNRVWSDSLPTGPKGTESASRLAADRNRVFWVGQSFTGRRGSLFLRARQGISGISVWTAEFDSEDRRLVEVPVDIHLTSNKLLSVVNLRTTRGAGKGWAILAHGLSGGELLWQQEQGAEPESDAVAMRGDSGRVYILLREGGTTGREAAARVRGVDAHNGAVQWDSPLVAPGGSREPVAMALHKNRLYTLSFDTAADDSAALVLQSLAGRNGNVRWETVLESEERSYRPAAIAADSSVIVTTGSVIADGQTRLHVATFATSSGRLLWEVDDAGVGGDAMGNGVLIAGGRTFIAGSLATAPGRSDFLVRAYATR